MGKRRNLLTVKTLTLRVAIYAGKGLVLIGIIFEKQFTPSLGMGVLAALG